MNNMQEYFEKEIADRKKWKEILHLYAKLQGSKNEKVFTRRTKALIIALKEYKEKLWGLSRMRQERNIIKAIGFLEIGADVEFFIDYIKRDIGNIFSFSSACGFLNYGGTYSERILALLAQRKLKQHSEFAFNVITNADKKGRPIIKFEKLTCDYCMLSLQYRMSCPLPHPEKCLGYKNK